MEQQAKEIDKLAKRVAPLKLLKGVEVNIKADGTLDVPDEVLAERDWVVASIHTAFDRSPTERILATMENPHVHVIGHLTGRKITRREPMEIDLERVIEKALETGTFLEINSQPDRLDLRDVNARLAGEAGRADRDLERRAPAEGAGLRRLRRRAGAAGVAHRRAGREHAHLGAAPEADEEVTPRTAIARWFSTSGTRSPTWPHERVGGDSPAGRRAARTDAGGVRRALVRRARALARDRARSRTCSRGFDLSPEAAEDVLELRGAVTRQGLVPVPGPPRRSPSCASAA